MVDVDIKDVIVNIVHEMNGQYCKNIGDVQSDLSEHTRESILVGVSHLVKQQNVLPSAEEQHNLWFKFKLENGWKYGDVKDEVNKTHPCMLPYSMLPNEQKAKDTLFYKSVFYAFDVLKSVYGFTSKDIINAFKEDEPEEDVVEEQVPDAEPAPDEDEPEETY